MKSSPVAVLALCALAVGALSGCASASGATQPTPSPSLAGRNSCSALTVAQAHALGLGAGTADNADDGSDSDGSFDALDPTAPSLGITYARGAHDDSGAGTRTFTVGRHRAYESTTPDSNQCEVDLAVGPDLAMIVGTGVSGGSGPACTLVTKAATTIEATLP
jgi:hypothetical protein